MQRIEVERVNERACTDLVDVFHHGLLVGVLHVEVVRHRRWPRADLERASVAWL